ncbi:MAG: hypothetical protein WC489_01165 [Patescibacteria group bacterium]
MANTQVEHIHESSGSNNPFWLFLTVILLIVLIFFFVYYGLPLIRSQNTGAPQIQVPDRLDVNIQQEK